jgi:hypothetical protein
MKKVFEIKPENSAAFYTYLSINLINFEAKEKPDVIVFTCEMTAEQFAAAVQYCNKLAEERKFNESIRRCKKLHEEYVAIQQVKETLDDLFHDINRQVLYEQKEAERELAEICVETIKKAKLDYVLSKDKFVELVTETGFKAMKNQGRLAEIFLPGWIEPAYYVQ